MNDTNLIRIGLIITLIGITALFFLSETIEINEQTISTINNEDDGKTVRLEGIVEKVRQGNNFTIIQITKKESIPILVFSEVNLSKGQAIEITGKTESYQGKKEIIAEKIRKLK